MVSINHGFGCSQPQPTLDKIVLYAGAGGTCFEEVEEREGQTDWEVRPRFTDQDELQECFLLQPAMFICLELRTG